MNKKSSSRTNGSGLSEDNRIDPPKRFLTAYNFFFMHERAAFLNGKGGDAATQSAVSSSLGSAKNSWTKKTKRDHVKTHGKISFSNLSKLIASKWKELPPEERQVYETLARNDLARYRRDLRNYKKKLQKSEDMKKHRSASAGMKRENDTKTNPSTTKTNEKDKKEELPITKQSANHPTMQQKTPSENHEHSGSTKDSDEQTRRQKSSSQRTSKSESPPFNTKKHPASPPEPHKHDALKKVIVVPSISSDSDSPTLSDSLEKVEVKAGRTPAPPLKGSAETTTAIQCTTSDLNSVSNDSENNMDDIESIAMESFTVGNITLDNFSLMSIADDDNNQAKDTSVINETLTTRIFCMSDPQNEYKGRTGAVAVKALTDQFPSPGQISRFENEFKVTQHLSTCQASRLPFRYVKQDGWHTLYMEWASGITLREWMNSAHGMKGNGADLDFHSDFDFTRAVRLAWAISKALAEIHDSGVVHNDITPEHIIVEVSEENDKFFVKLIGLGKASFSGEHDNDANHVQSDFLALGAVFFELFSGMSLPYGSEQATASYRNNSLDQNLYSKFRSMVPPCISTLVFNMIQKTGGRSQYQSVRDVDQELYVMLTDPAHFLLDQGSGGNDGQLKFPKDKLYGRGRHIAALTDAYMRLTQKGRASETILVSGSSGAGKSALVHQFELWLESNGAYCLCCKFHQFRHMEPLSAIISAFDGLCDEITSKDAESFHQTRIAVKNALGPEGNVLANVMPNFHKIIGVPSEKINKVGGIKAQNRLRFAFKLFTRAISTPFRPLVLLLDDMQWADPASLGLIESLISDAENKSLLLIGIYRDNEVDSSHSLSHFLRSIQKKGIPNDNIRVDYLDRTHLNELISDTLEMPPLSTQPLTDAVYRKTSGNVMFVLQFLRSLLDGGLLRFSFDSNEWQWDSESIISKSIADNVVELMSRKISKLPSEAQVAMKFLACLGSLCEELKLCFVSDKNSDGPQNEETGFIRYENNCYSYRNLFDWLDFAVGEGMLNYISSKYEFSHDQIQHAAYSLIPEKTRQHLHFQIGNQIMSKRDISSDMSLFVAVGQLNQGSAFITDKLQRIELACLNARAGEKAISSAVYPLAATYLETGITLLDEKCWEEQYSLCLKLYVSSAEAHYCNGDFEKMEKVLEVVFACGRCFAEKRAAYFTLISARIAQANLREATRVGLFVLGELGEPFPTSLDEEAVTLDLIKTKQMLETKTDNEILALHEMKDEGKIAVMHVLSSLLLCAGLAKNNWFPLFVCRMVQLSLSHGLCKNSTFGFAAFGVILSGSFGDSNGAYYFGQLSLRLLKQLKANECVARVHAMVCCTINPWVEPHRISLDTLKYSFQVGMRSGDIQYALLCAQQYCIHSYQCGEELSTVEKNMREYGNQMKLYKQELIWIKALPFRQAALNLMGRSDDPEQLTGEAMNQDHLLENALENKNFALVFVIYHNCSWLAYMFGNYELASQMAENGQAVVDQACSPTYTVASHAFIGGLSSLALARKTDQLKWKTIAAKSVEKMKKWAERAPANFQHKLFLLEAESAFLVGETIVAARHYDNAIEKAGEYGFVQEQALAHERAGIFHWSQGNTSKAMHHYGQAHDIYLKWGAKGKADHLRIHCPL